MQSSKSRAWRPRCSLAVLLIAMSGFCGVTAYFARYSAVEQRLVREIRERGGEAVYDVDVIYMHGEPPADTWRDWLWRKAVRSYIPSVDAVAINGADDAIVSMVSRGHAITYLLLEKSEITDEGLGRLASLSCLRYFVVESPNLSEGAVERLQAALPLCTILANEH